MSNAGDCFQLFLLNDVLFLMMMVLLLVLVLIPLIPPPMTMLSFVCVEFRGERKFKIMQSVATSSSGGACLAV